VKAICIPLLSEIGDTEKRQQPSERERERERERLRQA
jgi:hypothetical protein